ncbi:hypothetical protein D3C71_1387760 [compost metagenome]
MLSINGLISFPIIECFLNIRRQWHCSQPVQNLLKNTLINEPKRSSTHISLVLNNSTKLITKDDNRSCLELFTWLYKSFPTIVSQILKEKHFSFSPRIFFSPKQSGRNDSRIVQNKRISRLKIINNIGKMPVSQLPVLLIY